MENSNTIYKLVELAENAQASQIFKNFAWDSPVYK